MSDGMKLLIDPRLQAHLVDLVQIAWPRAEGQTIQRMQRLLILRHLRDGGGADGLRLLLRIQRGTGQKTGNVKIDRTRRFI